MFSIEHEQNIDVRRFVLCSHKAAVDDHEDYEACRTHLRNELDELGKKARPLIRSLEMPKKSRTSSSEVSCTPSGKSVFVKARNRHRIP